MKKSIEVHGKKHLMKKRVLMVSFLAFALGFISPHAPAKSPLASKQEIDLFMNSTTCVVLEESMMAYSTYIKNAVEKHWKITDYEFIDREEFEARRSDSIYSFLLLIKGTYDDDPEGVSYDFISLLMGGPAPGVEEMPELCTIPISYTGDESVEYGYAVPAFVRFMQIHARVLENRRLFISIFGLQYHTWSKKFRDKTLLLGKDMMAAEVNSLQKIREVYPYDVELLSAMELKEKLASDPDDTLFLFHVGPTGETGAGRCFEMIFDTGGILYYYHSRKITNKDEDGFTEMDLKRIR